MFDPRDDARDRDEREDGRARVYDERDREDDPREGLMRDLEGCDPQARRGWLRGEGILASLGVARTTRSSRRRCDRRASASM